MDLDNILSFFERRGLGYYYHYYIIDFCSRLFVLVVFGPGIIGGFCPGSNG